MHSLLWYIIGLFTNLCSVYTKDFTLTLTDEKKDVYKFHIKYIGDKVWTVDLPDENKKNTTPINFKMTNNATIQSLFDEDPLDLNKFFDVEKVEWKTVNEITVKGKGESPILITREKERGRIAIKQQQGFLQDHSKIMAEWNPKIKFSVTHKTY